MKLKYVIAASAAVLATLVNTVPASAQTAPTAAASSYTPGSVWVASRIDVLPGQFENYMDYLATTWKRVQELGRREGMVLSYRVLATQNARDGEPDLILIVEYRDFATTAQREAMSAKVDAMLAQNDRTAEAAGAQRRVMRLPMGAVMYQEMVLK